MVKGAYYFLQFLDDTKELFMNDTDVLASYIFQPGFTHSYRTTVISITRIRSYITGEIIPDLFNLEWNIECSDRDNKVFRWDDIDSAKALMLHIVNKAELGQIVSGEWYHLHIYEKDVITVPEILINQLLFALRKEGICNAPVSIKKELDKKTNQEIIRFTFSIKDGTGNIDVFTNLLEFGFIERTEALIDTKNGPKTFSIKGFSDLLFYPIAILPELCKIFKNTLS